MGFSISHAVSNIYTKMESTKLQRYLLLGAIVATFVLIFILNYLYPMHTDDRMYSILHYGESVRFPQTFIDIFKFQYKHYFEWGGRSVAHLLLQLMLLLSPLGQDIINSIVYVLFIYLIYRMINRENKDNFLLILLPSILLIYFTPRFTVNVFWITGSCNYLWTMLIILLAIYPHYTYSYGGIKEKSEDKISKAIWMFLFGIVAGWTNENMVPALLFIMIAYCIYFKVHKIKIAKWTISAMAGVIIGALFMILAPGNAVRAKEQAYVLDLVEGSYWQTTVSKLMNMITHYHTSEVFPLTIIFVICLFVFWCCSQPGEKKKQLLFHSILFFIASEIALFVTAFSPTFPIRAYFGIVVLKVIAIGFLYANISFDKIYLRVLHFLAFACIVLLATVEYHRTYNAFSLWNEVYKERIAIIDELKANGEKDAIFTRGIALDYKYEFSDLGGHGDYNWERYYELNSVKVIYSTK